MHVTDQENTRFQAICDEVIHNIRTENGVGTLQEKTIHAVLKNYFEPDQTKQEIKIAGFVADIFNGNEIIEIQTRGFYKLRRKLEAFLPLYPVTIVYPVVRTKWLRWINPTTGEVSKPRKSPKLGNVFSLFPEIYTIKMLLPNDRLSFHIVLLDVEEYRFLDGWSKDKKKGSTRSDALPLGLAEEYLLNNVNDYALLLPEDLEEEFTSMDLRNTLHCNKALAGVTLNVLSHLKAVTKIGHKGNAILYRK